MTTVAVFGGSFNPPHIAHVMATVFVLSTKKHIDQLLVVPCFLHPFSKALAPFEDRFAMCQLAFGWIPRVTVSPIERDLGGESRTIRTLRHLQAMHPTWTLRLVIGTDIVGEIPRWDSFSEIERLAPPIVLSRKGFTDSNEPLVVFPPISSTEIRQAIARGQFDSVRDSVPSLVFDYIVEASLYLRSDTP
ncbi:MAG TPA: nicotinate (nicotinamide) nucleotide adenylyltransferase [Polyangiaceae bacterium]|nr:MAG: putative nicotinate-nucleotide adenylyltransferase [Deltaproteobacteria bacterium ADurb.Bin207]HNS98566.1 nicotinate (nicotinamide) nucleotide adenylyltransferase [Polyangiaceae bacterium]HNZ25076.1 nicotinate (nicotinamide) nucleotide adenylyltransferase [Polyangiaceae bacterium]HOD25572.1 nicotinate (nicotinamide) nucleotide adenylyltransferase [Polyangiaceae bacterium]HOE49928.1 nicotinate (nicotinamide) nucleotide adenylyltransferase [Polyangiaceae bacterium]